MARTNSGATYRKQIEAQRKVWQGSRGTFCRTSKHIGLDYEGVAPVARKGSMAVQTVTAVPHDQPIQR